MACDMVSSRVCGGRNDFNSVVVNFLFLDRDVPRSPSCGVCVCFAAFPLVGDRFLTVGLHKAFLRR